MTSTWLADGWTVTWRNMLKFRRSPDYVVFAVLQPIMFVLLFSQVYGGSIRVDGTNYTDYLMAGIFGQTVLFGATFSGFGMAQDLKDGIIDRFRTDKHLGGLAIDAWTASGSGQAVSRVAGGWVTFTSVVCHYARIDVTVRVVLEC